MSIAEAYDVPLARAPLVPPSPPRAPPTMGRDRADRGDAQERDRDLGPARLEEDAVQGRFFGRSSFILNTPDAIRHVLVDNYENYYQHARPACGCCGRCSARAC